MSLTEYPPTEEQESNDNNDGVLIADLVNGTFGYATVLEIIGLDPLDGKGNLSAIEVIRSADDESVRHRAKLQVFLNNLGKTIPEPNLTAVAAEAVQPGPSRSDFVALVSHRLLAEHDLGHLIDVDRVHKEASIIVDTLRTMNDSECRKLNFDIGNLELELDDRGDHPTLLASLMHILRSIQAHESAGYSDVSMFARQVWATTIISVTEIENNR